MDLQLAFRVLWRFRIVVALGLLMGLVLALLAMAHVSLSSSPHFSYRSQPQYESRTEVALTTKDFPWWSIKAGADNGAIDIDTLRSLATVYPKYGTGNQVLAILRRSGPITGEISTYPVLAPDSSGLPMIGLTYVAPSARAAHELAVRHLRAFQTWLTLKQNRDGTLAKNRIILEPVTGPTAGALLAGRKLTKPILVFMAMALATFGLAFVLENMRPRIRPVADDEEQPPVDQRAERLTA